MLGPDANLQINKRYRPLSKLILLFLLMSNIVSIGCGSSPKQEHKSITEYGNIEGYIVAPVGSTKIPSDKINVVDNGNIGIPDAIVSVKCLNYDESVSTNNSDDTGYFRFDNIPHGNCILYIEKDNYQTLALYAIIIAGITSKYIESNTIVLKPMQYGSVTIETNMPGASIIVDNIDANIKMLENTFKLDYLAIGLHEITITHDNISNNINSSIEISNNTNIPLYLFQKIANSKICFSSERDSNFDVTPYYQNIYCMQDDGSNQQRLNAISENKSYRFPSVFTDGNQIVYTKTDNDGTQIYLYDINNNTELKLSNEKGSAQQPTVSYTSDEIIYTAVTESIENCSQGECVELKVIDTNGNLVKQITNNKYLDKDPSFSPDGRYVVFTSYRPTSSGSDIYLINRSNNDVIKLTDCATHDKECKEPSFSPDGKKIVFYSMQHNPKGIYSINIDGSGITLLLEDASGMIYPHYSPDGTKIVLSTDRYDGANRGSEIAIMNNDGTNLTRLTFTQGLDLYPTWTP